MPLAQYGLRVGGGHVGHPQGSVWERITWVSNIQCSTRFPSAAAEDDAALCSKLTNPNVLLCCYLHGHRLGGARPNPTPIVGGGGYCLNAPLCSVRGAYNLIYCSNIKAPGAVMARVQLAYCLSWCPVMKAVGAVNYSSADLMRSNGDRSSPEIC